MRDPLLPLTSGKDMKDVFQQQHEEEGDDIVMVNGKPQLSPEAQARRTERERRQNEEKARERAERVEKLSANLVRKLSIFTEAAKGPDDPQVGPSFKEICRLEAEDLKEESYGVDLLHSIGHTYKSRSAQYLVRRTSTERRLTTGIGAVRAPRLVPRRQEHVQRCDRSVRQPSGQFCQL